jgi:hypothetical protein
LKFVRYARDFERARVLTNADNLNDLADAWDGGHLNGIHLVARLIHKHDANHDMVPNNDDASPYQVRAT